jgi:hypothetical protein
VRRGGVEQSQGGEAMMSTTPIKERPILFSGPMVRAILGGRKTQTRRIMKPQPASIGTLWVSQDVSWSDGQLPIKSMIAEQCPYGRPGDRLWVRETWRMPVCFDHESPATVGKRCVDAGYRKPWSPIRYEADGDDKFFELINDFGGAWGKTRVSIHMPRWAVRITLEITGVRVERLNDISKEDAIAEGIELSDTGRNRFKDYLGDAQGLCNPINSFCSLWRMINGPGSWTENPWVWVVEFKKVQP